MVGCGACCWPRGSPYGGAAHHPPAGWRRSVGRFCRRSWLRLPHFPRATWLAEPCSHRQAFSPCNRNELSPEGSVMARVVAERSDVIPQLGELFRKHGFVGTSLSLITAHTGLGKGSLYHFFPGGKE